MKPTPTPAFSILLPLAARVLFLAASAASADAAEGAGAAPEPAELDFSTAEEGTEPEGLFVIEGEFVAARSEGGRTVLEMKPEPLVEGLVLVGDTLRGGGSIRAKIQASKRGRSFPRFGVGLHGISGYQLRVVPAQKAIEISKDDEPVGKIEYAWADSAWTWVELRVVVGEDEGAKARVEGRVWQEGSDRPGKPQLAIDVEGGHLSGKGVLSGTPYPGTPIRFDRIRVAPQAGG